MACMNVQSTDNFVMETQIDTYMYSKSMDLSLVWLRYADILLQVSTCKPC